MDLTGRFAAGQDDYVITLDDDPMIGSIIEKSLGIRTIKLSTSRELLAGATQFKPLAVFVDIHLGVDDCGLDVIPTLRARWPYCPILVLTGDPSDDSVARALAAGADDFLRKPINHKELLARLHARLEDAAEKSARQLVEVGDIKIDIPHRMLTGPLGRRALSPTEINILAHLSQVRGTVVTKDVLKFRCWGPTAVSDNAVDRKIHEVRSALQDVSNLVKIKSLYGVGVTLQIGADPTDPIVESVTVRKKSRTQ